MPLQRGEVLGYDFNRMVVDFTMLNQGKTVKCAISTAAMDDLEGKHDVKPLRKKITRAAVNLFQRLRRSLKKSRTSPTHGGRGSPNGIPTGECNISFRHPQSGRWSATRRPVLCCAKCVKSVRGRIKKLPRAFPTRSAL